MLFTSNAFIQDQAKINHMVAEYERNHPEVVRMQSSQGKMLINFNWGSAHYTSIVYNLIGMRKRET